MGELFFNFLDGMQEKREVYENFYEVEGAMTLTETMEQLNFF